MTPRRQRVGFALAVAVQLLILAIVPAPKYLPRLAGKTVLLKTFPVDPYSIFSGYYMILDYEISRPTKAQGWSRLPTEGVVFVVLAEDDGGLWHARSIHAERPGSPPAGCVVIRGRKEYDRVRYGIETYYVPETARKAIDEDFRRNADKARAEVKVGPFGHAVITKLLIQNRTYAY